VRREAFPGRVLRIDLTSWTHTVDEVDAATRHSHGGGSLLATRLLLDETPPGLDALDPRSPLLFMSSIVAGHRLPALPRFAVVGKSPLTGGIGEARAEGPFGVALKESGFDAIVCSGASDRPAVVAISDGRVWIGPADDLWRLDTTAVVDAIEARLGRCHVAAIGAGGEQLVRYASVVSDRSFAAPRMGLGAVMGAKRLKAIALRGGTPPRLADPGAAAAIAARYAALVEVNPVTRWQRRPPGFGAWVGSAPIGAYGVENYRTSAFDASGYAARAFERRLTWSAGGCPGCPSDCIKGFLANGGDDGISRTGGLHQEAIAALGPNLGLHDVADAIELNDRCLRRGLDPVSTGFTIAFAMECRAAGLLGAEQADGVDLRFGNAEAARTMVDRIASRTGFGDVLADGSARAATVIGGEAHRYSMTVKGLELPPFDPRAQAGLALGFATAPFGPRYDVAEHDLDYDDVAPSWPHALEQSRSLGIETLVPSTAQTSRKVRDFAILARLWSGFDALLVCPFASAPVRILSLDDVAGLVRAVTGRDVTGAQILDLGTQRLDLMRKYNAREGMGLDADRLPDRFLDEPIDAGRFAGVRLDRDAFGAMIRGYHALMDWTSAHTDAQEQT
jgi:aldehyde:ferredoxin oxidoreductase